MDRRAFLATAGALGAAGCMGDTGVGTPTPTPTPEEPSRRGASLGTSAVLNGISVTATDATVARQIFGEVSYYATEGVYLLVHVRLENVSDEPIRMPSEGAFSALSGDEQFETINRGTDELEAPVTGPMFAGGGEAHPGVASSGWLVFEVPDPFGDLTLAYSHTASFGEEAETGYWSLPVERDEAARLTNVSVDGPTSIGWGETVTFTFSADNVGDRTATVIYEAGFGNAETRAAVHTEESSVEIPPGETISVPFEHTPEERRTVRFIFNDFQQDVEVGPAEASFGDTVTTPGGLELRMGQQRLQPYYQLEGDEERTFTDSDRTFSFANLSWENSSNDSQVMPADFVISDGEQAYGAANSGVYFSDPTLVEPVSGPWLTIPMSVAAGGSESGWIVHNVDGSVREDDVEMRARNGDGDALIIWS